MNEPSFDLIKNDVFNFPVCKIYLGMLARKARRAHRARRAYGHVGHVGHVEHVRQVDTMGTLFSRLELYVLRRINFAKLCAAMLLTFQ